MIGTTELVFLTDFSLAVLLPRAESGKEKRSWGRYCKSYLGMVTYQMNFSIVRVHLPPAIFQAGIVPYMLV